MPYPHLLRSSIPPRAGRGQTRSPRIMRRFLRSRKVQVLQIAVPGHAQVVLPIEVGPQVQGAERRIRGLELERIQRHEPGEHEPGEQVEKPARHEDLQNEALCCLSHRVRIVPGAALCHAMALVWRRSSVRCTSRSRRATFPRVRLLPTRGLTLWIIREALALFGAEERKPVHEQNKAVERKR